MERLVKGDVIVIEFPFSNLMQNKRRPALIIKIPKGEEIIVSQITGKSYEHLVEVIIKKDDFKEWGLRVESYLRLDKIFSIEKLLIKYKVGSLKREKFDKILDK